MRTYLHVHIQACVWLLTIQQVNSLVMFQLLSQSRGKATMRRASDTIAYTYEASMDDLNSCILFFSKSTTAGSVNVTCWSNIGLLPFHGGLL